MSADVNTVSTVKFSKMKTWELEDLIIGKELVDTDPSSNSLIFGDGVALSLDNARIDFDWFTVNISAGIVDVGVITEIVYAGYVSDYATYSISLMSDDDIVATIEILSVELDDVNIHSFAGSFSQKF